MSTHLTAPPLRAVEAGGGRVDYQPEPGRARLELPATTTRAYANAQLDDYHGRPRRRFPDQAPQAFRLRARASHAQPAGTLGFGFWNDPFSILNGGPAAPQVTWFFYASPPSDMALAEGVPGWGWKAATLNAGPLAPWLLAPAALAALALMQVPGLAAPLMGQARRLARAQEALLEDVALNDWHTYAVTWQAEAAVFAVDGVERLRAPAPPRGPLGFVLWIDNQYAIASRAGRLQFGLCGAAERQWLEVEALTFTPG